ncbi:MAG TPA: hypothetical protein PKD85_09550, partial [Saprospiraceae bacterium]|nr:hypothetical protein [Saprospiraceae bacterium]
MISQLFKDKRYVRILLLFIVSYIIITVFLIVGFYNYSLKTLQQSELTKLKGIANAVSLQIKGDDHEKLFNMYDQKDGISDLGQDTCYDDIHLLLKKHVHANMLNSPLYTLVKSKNQNIYEFGITSDTIPYFRHPYQSFPVSLIEMYMTGGILEPYTDEFGSWLSAFNPIRNNKGEIVALLMVDEKIENFRNKLWSGISNSVLIIILFTLLIISILIYYLFDFLTREWK